MKKSLITSLGIAVVFAGVLLGNSAAAAERGFYVGVNYGQFKKDSEQTLYDQHADFLVYQAIGFEPTSVSTKFDSKDSAYGFVGGLRKNDYLAFEAGFVDTGEVSYRADATGISHRGDVEDEGGAINHAADSQESWVVGVRSRSKALAVSALAIYPVTYRSEVFARGGVLLSNSELSVSLGADNYPTQSVRFQSKTSFDPLVGVGAGFTFADIYSLRIEYQKVFDHGYKDYDEADADLISVGITVTF
jgi:opacity protein-like surface antigen